MERDCSAVMVSQCQESAFDEEGRKVRQSCTPSMVPVSLSEKTKILFLGNLALAAALSRVGSNDGSTSINLVVVFSI